MSYENAPATKLLATACACCGRALVDAVSVERGVGPDCAEMHGYAEAQGEADWTKAMALLDGVVAVADVNPTMSARDAVNVLVFHVAKKRRELNADIAACIFRAIAALGFTVLADRIAKRFRMTVEEAEIVEETGPSLEEMRAMYAKKLNAFAYDNATKTEINDAVRAFLANHGISSPVPADFLDAIEQVSCTCGRCGGTGRYVRGTENGRPMFGEGECFRCQGKGRQDLADAFRNRAYDAYRMTNAA